MTLTQAQIEEALLSYEESILLEPYQAELVKLQQHIEKNQLKLIVLFEGRDAAGKGSVIGSVSRYMNPKHYNIIALGKPTQEEKTQWYFQRYVKHLPDAGKIILFDRSWYNRAMVEPVFDFCSQTEYELFMKHVVPFEQSIIEEGTLLLKLYFSVTKDKQSLRFEQRRSDPLRQWKLSEIDLQAQSMWGQFTEVKYQMLKNTSHELSPWYVVRSDDKHKARVETIKLILSQVEYEGKNRNLSYEIDTEIVFTAEEEIKLMGKKHNAIE